MLRYPVTLEQILRFERANDLRVGVYGWDCKSVRVWHELSHAFTAITCWQLIDHYPLPLQLYSTRYLLHATSYSLSLLSIIQMKLAARVTLFLQITTYAYNDQREYVPVVRNPKFIELNFNMGGGRRPIYPLREQRVIRKPNPRVGRIVKNR